MLATLLMTPQMFLSQALNAAWSHQKLKKRLLDFGPWKPEQWQIDFKKVSDPEIKKLNQLYRSKNKATDILSFESPLKFKQTIPSLGLLVVGKGVVQKQARALGHTQKREVEILLIHGLLHLLGYDHEKSLSAAHQMIKLEAFLLEKLEITDPGLIKRTRSITSKR